MVENCPISKHFGAAAKSYDRQPGVQSRVAHRLATRISKGGKAVSNVLEVGCGTGFLTAHLCRFFPDTPIVAVDIAGGMLDRVRTRLPQQKNLQLIRADICELEMTGMFSLIASSSALHWMMPLDNTLRLLSSFLHPGGRLSFAMMVRGTLAELHALREEVAPQKPYVRSLPTTSAVFGLMRCAGFTVEDWTLESSSVRYNSAFGFMKSLKRQGVTGGFVSPDNMLTRGEIRKLAEKYRRRFPTGDGGIRASYKVLYADAVSGKKA